MGRTYHRTAKQGTFDVEQYMAGYSGDITFTPSVLHFLGMAPRPAGKKSPKRPYKSVTPRRPNQSC